jgi:hypothetical protein
MLRKYRNYIKLKNCIYQLPYDTFIEAYRNGLIYFWQYKKLIRIRTGMRIV